MVPACNGRIHQLSSSRRHHNPPSDDFHQNRQFSKSTPPFKEMPVLFAFFQGSACPFCLSSFLLLFFLLSTPPVKEMPVLFAFFFLLSYQLPLSRKCLSFLLVFVLFACLCPFCLSLSFLLVLFAAFDSSSPCQGNACPFCLYKGLSRRLLVG